MVRPEDLPDTAVLLADNCARRWQVAHTTFTVCTGLAIGEPAVWRYRGRTHEQPGDGLRFMEPGEVHANTVQTSAASLRVLTIEPELVDRAAHELGARGAPHFRLAQTNDRDHPELHAAFVGLHASLEGSATSLERQTNLAASLRLLLEHVSEVPSQDDPQRPRTQPPSKQMARTRDFIEEHLGEAISVQSLLSAAGTESQFQLIRQFKRSFGLPPHAYQLSRRIGRARSLLAGGMAPAEVAMELGFADQSHFARHFKRALGVSPGQYFRHAHQPA